MSVMTGYPDYGGTPIVTGDLLLLNETNQTLAQGANHVWTADVVRDSYNIRLETWNSTNSLNTIPVEVIVTWNDSASGLALDRQIFSLYAGTASHTHVVRGRGFTEGDQMAVTITNNSASAVTLEYNLIITMSTRSFQLHDWRTDAPQATVFPGFSTFAECNPQAGIACGAATFSVSTNSVETVLLPLMQGPVWITLTTTGGAGTVSMELANESDSFAGSTSPILEWTPASNTVPPIPFYMPRTQLILLLDNSAAATESVSCSIVGGIP